MVSTEGKKLPSLCARGRREWREKRVEGEESGGRREEGKKMKGRDEGKR